MTRAKLETAQREMRTRSTTRKHITKAQAQARSSQFAGPFEGMKAGLEKLAEIKMPYAVAMSEMARLYVRMAVKVHGSHTKAAKAIQAHRNTLWRAEAKR